MHLHLPFPPLWQLKQAPDERRMAILPSTDGGLPEAIVTFGPIIIKPDEPKRWVEPVLRSDLRSDVKVERGETIERTTLAGWSLQLVEAQASTPNGEMLETRLCAFYTFMEHGASVVVRTADRAHMDRHRDAIVAVLEQGRPDWRGEPLCIAELWDLDEAKLDADARRAPRTMSLHDDDAAMRALADVEQVIAVTPTAADHVRRGVLLLELGRATDAVSALETALALDPQLEPALYYLGVALGQSDNHRDAAVAWERALALAPEQVDTHYNLAQARFALRDYEAALAGFQTVVELAPSDFMVQRKVIQCLYALGRYDRADQARLALRAAWTATTDARAELISEYVFDQFEANGFWVHAVETLRPRDPAIYAVLAFRAYDHLEQPLPALVAIETSEQARVAGTPYVLTVTAGAMYHVVGASQQLPPYVELKQTAIELLTEALRLARRR
jgi:Flp pilus assembly protein TadD